MTMTEMMSDREIIKKILDGSKDDFRIIIRRYRKLVYHIVCQNVNHLTDREELGQEIFIKIYKNLGSFQFRSNLATWITKIAYHACLNYRRKKKLPIAEGVNTGEIDRYKFNTVLDNIESSSPNPIEEITAHQAKVLIHQEMDALPSPYREIMMGYHYDEQSYKTIGQAMDLPEGTVKSYMFRARKMLKERLLEKVSREELCI